MSDAVQVRSWRGIPQVGLWARSDLLEKPLTDYLTGLQTAGFNETLQGVWLQSGTTWLGDRDGTIPRPAASLTKVATTLVALDTWKPQDHYETLVLATGPIRDGVLYGDLVVQGGGDPLFVWEEAIALGNGLNQQGVREVTGDLVITGNFVMNYEQKQEAAGELLRQGLNVALWPPIAVEQFLQMPKGTPQPTVTIKGKVRLRALTDGTPLVRRRSLPLWQILKHLNVYSDNDLAELLGQSLGGGAGIAQRAAQRAGVPASEVQLINASGLGHENQLSPRAVCGMLLAIQTQLQPHGLTVGDVFPVAGRDQGTLTSQERRLPTGSAVKTGSLWDVSALAGVIPTGDRGPLWFAIINRGEGIETLRVRQDQFLQTVQQQFSQPQTIPQAIAPTQPNSEDLRVGASSRNQLFPGR